jgi:DNA polymerase III epsilon subunit-like protein
MSCTNCQEGIVYTCTNCWGPADYDYEFGRAFCNTCEILRENYSVIREDCPNCMQSVDIPNLKEIASKYREFGFNITCISSKLNDFNKHTTNFFKTPCQPWDQMSRTEQNDIGFEKNDWDSAIGLGTVTKWNNLFVIDIDGCNDIDLLEKMLRKLGLPINYEWVVKSGSNNGFHIYLYGGKIRECNQNHVVSTFPPKDKFEKYLDKVEFLWETHCVLPPSVHGSGNRYIFLNCTFPKAKPLNVSADIVYDFINEFLKFEEIINGETYGGVTLEIKPKEEFVPEAKIEDITKYLLEDIYCIVDIETNGFPENVEGKIKYPEILQVAWVLTNSKGVLIKKKSFIVKSDFFKNNSKAEILNIDFSVANIVGVPINEIMAKFLEDLKISDFVVSHNTDFDISILSNYFLSNFNINPFSKKSILCTMKSTIDFCKIENKYGYKFPKLSELYFKIFNYQLSNSHNAEVDVLHTLKCFKKLKELNII